MENKKIRSVQELDDISSIDSYEVARRAGLTNEEALETITFHSRDNARTPMQWSDEEHAGFTTGDPWLRENPNYRQINVQEQLGREDSVLSYYKKLIALRKAEEIIQAGDVHFLESPADQVIAYERMLGDERVVVQCNFSGDEQPALTFEGGEIRVSNYDEPGAAGVLRPWEGTALIWR